VAKIDMDRKEGGCCALFAGEGSWVPSNTMWPGPRSTSVPSGVFIDLAVSPQETSAKNWLRAVPFFLGGGSWVPIEHKVAWSEAYLHTKWHLNPSSHLATTDMGPKLGDGDVPLWGKGAGSPSNTMWPELRYTGTPSFILIRLAVWPQCRNVTDRQDRRRSLQTVTQKLIETAKAYVLCVLSKLTQMSLGIFWHYTVNINRRYREQLLWGPA